MFLISDLVKCGVMRDNSVSMPFDSIKTDSDFTLSKDETDLDEVSISNKGCELDKETTVKKQKKDNQCKFKCTFEGCNAAFPRPWRLQNHIKVHYGEKTYKCMEEGCDKAYTSNSHLVRHIIQIHKNAMEKKQTYPCEVKDCGKVLKTRDILVKHMMRFHTERQFTCSVCFIKFRTKEQLESHSKNRHKDRKSHRCEQCKLQFLRLGPYNRHMRGHRMHLCPTPSCLFVTDDYSLLRHHVTVFHPKCPKVYQCDTCGNSFKTKANLKRHIILHLIQEGLTEPQQGQGPVTFSCTYCHLNLSTKASLNRHVKLIHETPADLRINKPGRCKPRAARKDKNLHKQSIATKLTQVKVPQNIEKAILSKLTYSADDETSQIVYNLMLEDIRNRTAETIFDSI